MRIGGRARLWLAVAAVIAAVAGPASAAPKRGELVLRGTAGSITVSLPDGIRLAVRDGMLPAPTGKVRGVVIREASSTVLVLASVSIAVPGADRVGIFRRGQGYETGRLNRGRYRITLLGDAKGAKDIVLPVEGLAGRRVLKLEGGAYQNGFSLADPAGTGSRSYRTPSMKISYPMGLIWAYSVQRGAGLHRVQFCVAQEGADCPPEEGGFSLETAPTEFTGTHFSAPTIRPADDYEFVLDTTSVGAGGRVGLVGFVFI